MFKNTLINIKPIEIFSFILCLLPIALVIGPFLSDLIVSTIGIYFLYCSFKNQDFSYFKNFFVYLFIFFYIYITARSIFSVNPLLSLESSLFYFRFILFSLGVAYIINNSENFLFYFSRVLFFSLFILVADAYLQFFSGFNIFGWPSYGEYNVSGLFKEELILGDYLVRIMPIGFALLTIHKSSKFRNTIYALILLILVDILIYLSGDRTAFFFLCMATIVIIFLSENYKYLRVITFVVSVLLILILTNYFPLLKDRMIDLTAVQFGMIENNKFSEILPSHLHMLQSSWQMFLDNPIFGHGPKLFRYLCDDPRYFYEFGCSTHPHSTYLQLLAEIGIVGTLPIIICLLYVIFNLSRQVSGLILRKTYKISDYRICLLVALLITLFPLVPSFNFFNNWISILYFLPVGFLIADKNRVNIK